MSTTVATVRTAQVPRSSGPVVISAPADATGAALTKFVHRVRAMSLTAEVRIDTAGCGSWSPGQLLVLERVQAWLTHHQSRLNDAHADAATSSPPMSPG